MVVDSSRAARRTGRRGADVAILSAVCAALMLGIPAEARPSAPAAPQLRGSSFSPARQEQVGFSQWTLRLRGGRTEYNAEWEHSYKLGEPTIFAACRVGDLPVVLAALDKMEEEGDRPANVTAVLPLAWQTTGVNAVDHESGRTALHWAAAAGRLEVVQMLLERGADVMKGDSESGWLPLQSASSAGHTEVVEELLKHGDEQMVNMPTGDDCQMTPLHLACAKNHSGVARLLLATEGILTDQRDGAGATPLWRAGSLGTMELVDMLLDRGADINDRDYFGNTTLHVACTGIDEDLILDLLKRGADPLAENGAGVAAVDGLEFELATSISRKANRERMERGEKARTEEEQEAVENEVAESWLELPAEPLQVYHHCCGGENSPDHDPTMCTRVMP